MTQTTVTRQHITVELKFKYNALNQTAKLASYEHVCHVYLVFSLILQGVLFPFFFSKIPADNCFAPAAHLWMRLSPLQASTIEGAVLHPFAPTCPAGLQGWWSLSQHEDQTGHQFTRRPQTDKQPSTCIFTPTYILDLSSVSQMFMSVSNSWEPTLILTEHAVSRQIDPGNWADNLTCHESILPWSRSALFKKVLKWQCSVSFLKTRSNEKSQETKPISSCCFFACWLFT